MRKGYDPYNSHEARRKASDTVEFSIDSRTVAKVREAQRTHVLQPIDAVDWSHPDVEEITLETHGC